MSMPSTFSFREKGIYLGPDNPMTLHPGNDGGTSEKEREVLEKYFEKRHKKDLKALKKDLKALKKIPCLKYPYFNDSGHAGRCQD